MRGVLRYVVLLALQSIGFIKMYKLISYENIMQSYTYQFFFKMCKASPRYKHKKFKRWKERIPSEVGHTHFPF